MGLAGIYRAGVRLGATGPTRIIRWAGLTSAAWLVAGLVQSVATVTFTGPPVYGLLLGLAGVVAALSDPVHRDAAPVRAGRRPYREPVAGVEDAVGVLVDGVPVDVVVVGEHEDDVGRPRSDLGVHATSSTSAGTSSTAICGSTARTSAPRLDQPARDR